MGQVTGTGALGLAAFERSVAMMRDARCGFGMRWGLGGRG